MRGRSGSGDELFSFVRLEERVPADHPLRAVRGLADEVLAGLSGSFSKLYAHTGRPSIPPEMLLRTTLLQALYSVRSERMLMKREVKELRRANEILSKASAYFAAAELDRHGK